MAKQVIDIGSAPGDGTGDPARTAFDKVNDNFTELYDGKLDLDGSAEMTGDIVMAEQADHSSTPAAGKGYVWTKSTTPSTLIFTDDAGTDTTLGTSTPEGTAILSTGEVGGTKYLREDGDGTCSWQAVAGGSGAFEADGDTQITATTPIVLDQATGNEVALTLDYTVNKATSGNDTGLLVNMTDTASPGTSWLADFQIGGTSLLRVGAPSGQGVQLDRGRVVAGGSGVSLASGKYIAWSSNATDANSSLDTYLYRDAANTLALRNSTNAQTFNVYGTFTDSSNLERLAIGHDGTDAFINYEALGTGTAGNIKIKLADNAAANKLSILDSDDAEVANIDSDGRITLSKDIILPNSSWIYDSSGTITLQSTQGTSFLLSSDVTSGDAFTFAPALAGRELTASSGTQSFLTVQPEVNQSGTAGYTGIHLDVTETATGSGSNLLMDLQVGGVSLANFDNGGKLTLDPAGTFGTGTGVWFGDGDTGLYENSADVLHLRIGGADEWQIYGGYFRTSNSNGPAMRNQTPTATNVTFMPSKTDTNTGLGWAAADQLSLIAGGVEGIRIRAAASAITDIDAHGPIRVFGSYTDDSNYERLSISGATIAAENAGTGSAQDIVLKMSAGKNVSFQDSTGSEVVQVQPDGDILLPATKKLYFGTTFQYVGSGTSDSLVLRSPTQFKFWQGADTTETDVFWFHQSGATQELVSSSGVQRFLSVEPIMNQSGTAGYTGIHLDVTETATGSGDTLLMDLQVGGVSAFKVDNAGLVKLGDGLHGNEPQLSPLNNGLKIISNSKTNLFVGNNPAAVQTAADYFFGWTSAAGDAGGTADTKLNRDAANTLALRNSTNAQEFRVYGTYTDASNNEYLSITPDRIQTASNGTGTTQNLEVGGTVSSIKFMETGGVYLRQSSQNVFSVSNVGMDHLLRSSISGTTPAVQFRPNGTASLAASNAQQAWLSVTAQVNQTSTAGYTGILLDVTETATGSGSNLLMDLQVGSASKFSVDNTATVESDKGTADEPFWNFKATADADATSAISTLTTSGSVTHHIQISINGTTAWIPCSTTDPS